MSKVVPLSPEQKERLMQRLQLLRKLNDGGIDIIGFTLSGSRIDFKAKATRLGYEPSEIYFTMYTNEPEFYKNVYQNKQEQ